MEDEQIKKPAKIMLRSVAYPAVNLEDAIDSMAQLRKNIGLTGRYSRETAIQGLGYKGVSGASARKVAALVHYGLLQRSGNVYQSSPLSDAILMERSPQERQQAVIDAFKSPKLFRDLWERYQGSALPAMFANVLAREYKINPKVAGEVTELFQRSAEYAGLLVSGIMLASPAETSEEDAWSGKEAANIPPTMLGVNQASFTNSPQKYESATSSPSANFVPFPFPGGITLLVPMTEQVSQALLNGALKTVSEEINKFAKEHIHTEQVTLEQPHDEAAEQ